MSTAIKYLNSTMPGAPSLQNGVSDLIDVLDACLINGMGSITLDSLVVASSVATATYASTHGFVNVGTLGPVVTIAGATPSSLNGEKRITVTSTTAFTFASTESDQTATGTITAKLSPAGWEKAYTGTNKAAYRSLAVGASGYLLRVDDSVGGNAPVRGYESMTDVDTGSELFPTAAQSSTGLYAYKSNAASDRAWRFFGDDRFFHFICASGGTLYAGGLSFGDIASFSGDDADAVVLIASSTTTGASSTSLLHSSTSSYFARSYSGVAGAVTGIRYSHYLEGSNTGGAGEAYPCAGGGTLHALAIQAYESTTSRGMFPGMYNPMHNTVSLSNEVFEDLPALPNRILLCSQIGANSGYNALFDLTGPWR